MLVLSRKLGERIVIGGDIVITVVGTSGDRIRLGISAPAHVSVHREEVLQRMCIQEKGCSRESGAKSRFIAECA